MSSATPRTPVFSYTKMSPNPPITTVMEQCFWATPIDRPYTNGFGRNWHKKFQRPKTCQPLGTHEKKTDCRARPKSSSIPPTSFLTSMKIAGEKCAQSKQYLIPTSTEKPYEQERCTTPDYMDEVYDEYANDLNNHLLLRRPVSEMSFREYKQNQSKISSRSYDINPSEDYRQFAVRSVLEHMVKTPARTIDPEMVKYMPDERVKLPGICKDELCTTEIAEPPKSKVTIDIALCDDTGLLLNGSLPLKNNQHGESDKYGFNVGDILESCSSTSPDLCFEQNDKSKPQKAKKKPPRNSKRKIASKKKSVTVVAKFPLENVHEDESSQKFEEQIQRNEWKNPEDKIVTQMSALGLARPLNEGDLGGIRNTTSSILTNIRKQQLREHNINIGETLLKQNVKPVSVKDRRRKIPIQVICDPFKPIGMKPVLQPNNNDPCKQCRSSPVQQTPRSSINYNNYNTQDKKCPRLIVCKKTNSSLIAS